MKYVLAILLVALAIASAAHAQDKTLIRYQLDNGLDVILVPDDRVPKVVVDLSYRVGSMNEPPGRSGFAHLFEHLMFAGTPAYPNIDIAYGPLGVSINAYTWDDRTTYFAEGLSSALPFMLSVEADRMANQGASITVDDLDIQRDVVLNEMRQNVLDLVSEAGMEALRTSLFPSPHPYSRAIIGSIPDLEAATIDDVHAFFDIYYVPNNATLAVVGDFDVERTRAMIDDTFGRVTRGPGVGRPNPAPFEPPRVTLEFEDRVPTPMVLLGWSVPAIQEQDAGYMRLVVELWNNPDYGLFRRTLVDPGLANSVEVSMETGVLGSRLIVRISAAEGQDPVAVEAAARAAVAAFLAVDLSEPELERERRKLILGDHANNERLLNLADDILIFTEVADDPMRAIVDDPNVIAATPALVLAAARRHLRPEDASVVFLRAGDRGGYPAVLTHSSGTSTPLDTAPRAPVAIPAYEADPILPADPPVRETATLRNGMVVVHYRIPGTAMNHLIASSRSGTLSVPRGEEGAIEFAAEMAASGPVGMLPADFGRAIKDLGAELGTKAAWHAAGVTLTAPPETLAPALALMARSIREPAFDTQEWIVTRAEMLDELGRREGDLDEVAIRYAESALLQQPDAARIDRSFASVGALTLDQVKAITPRVFNPEGMTFYSTGPSTIEEIAAALDAAFGDWVSAAEPLPAVEHAEPAFPTSSRVLLVPEAGASQAAVLVAIPAPSFGTADYPAANAVANVLAYDFVSRINAVIREEKAYTYGTGGAVYGASLRNGSILTVEAPVERDTVGPALEEIANGFASLATDLVRQDELQRSIVNSNLAIASIPETAVDLFDSLWNQVSGGSTLEDLYAFRAVMTGLVLPDVQAEGRTLSSLDRALIVVVGDPEAVLPQLREFGLPVEVVERDL